MKNWLVNIRQRLGAKLVQIGARMTDPRSWPNNAADARDRAAEAAQRGVRTLDPVVNGEELDAAEQARRVGLAHSLFHLIARILERAGAQTRP